MNTQPNEGQGVIVGGNIIGGGIEVPPEQVDKDFWRLVLLYQFWYSIAGLIAGLACVLGGVVLFLNGIDGLPGSQWTADVFGLKISDAAPGVVLFLIGLAVTEITRFTVRLAPRKPSPPQKP